MALYWLAVVITTVYSIVGEYWALQYSSRAIQHGSIYEGVLALSFFSFGSGAGYLATVYFLNKLGIIESPQQFMVWLFGVTLLLALFHKAFWEKPWLIPAFIIGMLLLGIVFYFSE